MEELFNSQFIRSSGAKKIKYIRSLGAGEVNEFVLVHIVVY